MRERGRIYTKLRLLSVIALACLSVPNFAIAKNWNTKSTNYADLDAIAVEDSFPKHRGVLHTECKTSDGKSWNEKVTVYYSEDLLVGWQNWSRGAKIYVGKQYKPGQFLLRVSSGSSGGKPKTDWMTYRWKAKTGFDSLEQEKIWGLYGNRSNYWRDCGINLVTAKQDKLKNVSLVDAEKHYRTLLTMEQKQKQTLTALAKYGLSIDKKYDFSSIIKALKKDKSKSVQKASANTEMKVQMPSASDVVALDITSKKAFLAGLAIQKSGAFRRCLFNTGIPMNKIYIAQTEPNSSVGVETQISATESGCWSLLATGDFDTTQDSFSKAVMRLQANQSGKDSDAVALANSRQETLSEAEKIRLANKAMQTSIPFRSCLKSLGFHTLSAETAIYGGCFQKLLNGEFDENYSAKANVANSEDATVNLASGIANTALASEVTELLKRNAELLSKTEFYRLRFEFSFKNFKHKWSEDFDVIVSNEHLFAVREYSKGKKFIFGKAEDSNKFQILRGYEYYEPNKNKAPISLKFSEKGLFIDSIVAGASIDGHVNWKGKWRLEANGVPTYGATPVKNIKTKFDASIRSADAKTLNLLLKELSRRRAILKSYSSGKKQMEGYFGSRGVFNAKFGDDLNHLVVDLDRLYDEVLALVEKHKEPETLIASATDGIQQEEELSAYDKLRSYYTNNQPSKTNEAETRRLAKLEEERKAKEAEALRLAKLEEERKAKEAEALRLAKLEEERKAKEAEALRLAKLEEERKAKEAEALRLAKLEEERKAKEAEALRLAKLEEERKAKEAEELRIAELAKLKASEDDEAPAVFAEVVSVTDFNALVKGRITDNNGVSVTSFDGQELNIDSDGSFSIETYIPRSGKSVLIEALDVAGNKADFSLELSRQQRGNVRLANFEPLNPSKQVAAVNKNAVALIVGISEYERTEIPAIFADNDAQYFYDYALLKLGVPERNIKELINTSADESEILIATKSWITRSVKQGESDVFIFFAGHGLASDDGEDMYLLPYDGAPQLLDKTAIRRKELFDDISAANPRSVTVFLDTCYSGTTRSSETLIASRPISLKAKAQSIPDGFSVFTAAANDQTAKPLEEAKHGLFSYFLMKGMEGAADINQDKQITTGELHTYVQQNVIQQSSGTQTPGLQGDEERVLVRFQ